MAEKGKTFEEKAKEYLDRQIRMWSRQNRSIDEQIVSSHYIGALQGVREELFGEELNFEEN